MHLSQTLLFLAPFAAAMTPERNRIESRGYSCIQDSVTVPCSCSVSVSYNCEWGEHGLNRWRSLIYFSGTDQNGNTMDISFMQNFVNNSPDLDGCSYRLNNQLYQMDDPGYAAGQWVIDWSYTGGTGNYGACVDSLNNEWQKQYGCDDGSLAASQNSS